MFAKTLTLAFALLLSHTARAQGVPPAQWDVITVKPHKAGETSNWWRWSSDGLEMSNVPLKNIIANSQGVQTWLVFGLPSWAESTRWDIKAKLTDVSTAHIESLSTEQRHALMTSMLQERFGLVMHAESKMQPVFVMTVIPEGVKLKQSPPPPPGEPEPKFGRGSFMINNGVAEARNVKSKDVAEVLSGQLERNVIDRTGLTGDWDFNLKWQPEGQSKTDDNGTDGDTLPSLIQAVKEQLGLKLTADKASVPTVVVDRLVQPEEN